MNICVVTDENAGFKKEELDSLPIFIIKMPILIDGNCFFESTISEDEFYKRQEEKENISTSQPAPGEIFKLWDSLLTKYDAILHIPMSSGLSTACETAKMLAEDYKDKVFVVDNHSISLTLKRSVLNAINLIKDGKKPLEIKEILENEYEKTSIYIMVDTLTYLKRGGRVTAAGAMIGNTLHIKPILSINGFKLDAKAKAIGVKNAKKTMFELIKHDLETKFNGLSFDELEFGLAYTHNIDNATIFKDEFFNEIKPKNFKMDPLSLSIATHIGPGSLALTISRIIK